MKQKYFLFLLFSLQTALLSQVSAAVRTESSYVNMEELSSSVGEVVIKPTGNNVRIQNANGKTLEVYGVTGKCVLVVSIDTNDKTITLPSSLRGIYILKVGTVTKSVAFK